MFIGKVTMYFIEESYSNIYLAQENSKFFMMIKPVSALSCIKRNLSLKRNNLRKNVNPKRKRRELRILLVKVYHKALKSKE